MSEKIRETKLNFLEEYKQLCEKHKYFVWSCGCCPERLQVTEPFDFDVHISRLTCEIEEDYKLSKHKEDNENE